MLHSGQVDDVPRSFTSTTSIPASSALSDRQASRCVRRQLRSARLWCLPQCLVVMRGTLRPNRVGLDHCLQGSFHPGFWLYSVRLPTTNRCPLFCVRTRPFDRSDSGV